MCVRGWRGWRDEAGGGGGGGYRNQKAVSRVTMAADIFLWRNLEVERQYFGKPTKISKAGRK